MSAVIAGLLDAGGPDLRLTQSFVGTSAGSIVATRLAAGQDMREYIDRRFSVERSGGVPPAGHPVHGLPETDGAGGDGAFAAVAAALLDGTRPAGALLRRTVLKAIPAGTEELSRLGGTIERLMPDWDPRLALVGVELRRGTRMVIRGEDDLGLSPSEAVRASCAIPGVFRPVDSARGPIVDGGVWSPVNLDALRPEAGSTVLCLYPSGYRPSPRSLRRSATGRISRTRVAMEAATLRRLDAQVLVVAPDADAAVAIGPNRMDHRRDEAVAEVGYRQGAALAGRFEQWLDGAKSHSGLQP
jgi:NTE family protein